VVVIPPGLDGAEKKTIERRRILELRGSEKKTIEHCQRSGGNSTKNDAVSCLFLFYFIFFKQMGIFVALHTQNDAVLDFPSILIVTTNGGGYFIRGW
jgi:hypothetical protein